MAKRRGSGRATITDVAKHAGVGAITVSRMLRDPSKVSLKLRSRIEAAITELKYIPDAKAQALASGKTNVIGVLIPSLSNIIFADILRGIHDSIKKTPYQIQIGNTRYDNEEEDRLISLFVGQRPTAMIITGVDQSKSSLAILEDLDFPLVQIMDLSNNPIDQVIGFSNISAAKIAVNHLISQKYTKVGTLIARMDPRAQQRLQGYRSCLKEQGLYDQKRESITTEFSSVKLGRTLLSKLLQQAPDTNAVFCGNDDIALGALFECQARGISVPEEMGIVGFNDLEMMAETVPSLTSVRTKRYDIGRLAVEKIIQRLEGGEITSNSVDIGFDLIERESTKRS